MLYNIILETDTEGQLKQAYCDHTDNRSYFVVSLNQTLHHLFIELNEILFNVFMQALFSRYSCIVDQQSKNRVNFFL